MFYWQILPCHPQKIIKKGIVSPNFPGNGMVLRALVRMSGADFTIILKVILVLSKGFLIFDVLKKATLNIYTFTFYLDSAYCCHLPWSNWELKLFPLPLETGKKRNQEETTNTNRDGVKQSLIDQRAIKNYWKNGEWKLEVILKKENW